MSVQFIIVRLIKCACLAFFAVFSANAFNDIILADELNNGTKAFSERDFEGAVKHWIPLAESGDPLAQFNIALVYDRFDSSLTNSALAVKWYRRSAYQGLSSAQYNLAIAFQQGRGVTKNTESALFWMLLAAAGDDKNIVGLALESAKKLTALLKRDQRLAVVNLVDAWVPVIEDNSESAEKVTSSPPGILTVAEVKVIQTRLIDLGFDPGPVDGIAGIQTQKAISLYFQGIGLNWTHAPLSRKLLDILK